MDRAVPARCRGTLCAPRRGARGDGRAGGRCSGLDRLDHRCRAGGRGLDRLDHPSTEWPSRPDRSSIMTASTQHGSRHETQIVADPALPTIRITREFEAPVERVFRAHTDPELLAQWLGPRSVTMRIDHFDCRTGGSWRYSEDSEQRENRFYGPVPQGPADEAVGQTLTLPGQPAGG